MDTWYTVVQGRVHGHMVHGWTRKSVWTHGTRLDKEECMDTWYMAGEEECMDTWYRAGREECVNTWYRAGQEECMNTWYRAGQEEFMDMWYRVGQGRVHGHMVYGWTRKSAWTRGTGLE